MAAPASVPVPVPVALPAGATTIPQGMLDPALTNVITGNVKLDSQLLPELLAWLASTGWTILLVSTLTLLGLRMYGLAVSRVTELVTDNMPANAVVRGRQRAATLAAIVRSLGRAMIVFMACTIVLSKLGVNIAPIIASAGIVGLAVGFGAQSLVKDVISGFFILLEDQYGVGDVIELAGQTGLVERMNLRITQVRIQNGALVTIPNGTVSTLINHSKEWSRAVIEVGIQYTDDPDRVIEALKKIGDELQLAMPDKILEPIEVLGVDGFRDSEAVVKLQIKTVPLEQWVVGRAFRRLVVMRFKEWGIAIPGPTRTVHIAGEGTNFPTRDEARAAIAAAEGTKIPSPITPSTPPAEALAPGDTFRQA